MLNVSKIWKVKSLTLPNISTNFLHFSSEFIFILLHLYPVLEFIFIYIVVYYKIYTLANPLLYFAEYLRFETFLKINYVCLYRVAMKYRYYDGTAISMIALDRTDTIMISYTSILYFEYLKLVIF